MEPDGSQMTPEYSEDMDWLEQFPRPNTNSGTDLSGLDWDGQPQDKTGQQKSEPENQQDRMGHTHGSKRESWEWGRGRASTNNSRVPFHLPKYLILECPRTESSLFYLYPLPG